MNNLCNRNIPIRDYLIGSPLHVRQVYYPDISAQKRTNPAYAGFVVRFILILYEMRDGAPPLASIIVFATFGGTTS